MANAKTGTKSNPKARPKETKTRGGPKPDTMLGYVLDYLDEHAPLESGVALNVVVLTPTNPIKDLIDSLRDDIVNDALARR